MAIFVNWPKPSRFDCLRCHGPSHTAPHSIPGSSFLSDKLHFEIRSPLFIIIMYREIRSWSTICNYYLAGVIFYIFALYVGMLYFTLLDPYSYEHQTEIMILWIPMNLSYIMVLWAMARSILSDPGKVILFKTRFQSIGEYWSMTRSRKSADIAWFVIFSNPKDAITAPRTRFSLILDAKGACLTWTTTVRGLEIVSDTKTVSSLSSFYFTSIWP